MIGTGRRALVSGATGFVGRHLVRRLVDDGWLVDALVRRADAPLPDGAHSVLIPGGTPGLVERVAGRAPDVCWHLATHYRATHSPAEVEPLVAANIAFPAALAEAVSRSRAPGRPPPVFIDTGTISQHFDGHEYDPVSLYAATKQAFADVLTYYARVEGLVTGTVELCDTYGPDDPRGKLIPTLVGAAREGRPVELSSGDQLLDPIHVDDAVAALLAGASAVAAEGPERRWAATSGAPVTIRRLVELVGDAVGRPVDARWDVHPRRPREMLRPWATEPPPPGWHPQVDLATGLRQLASVPDPTAPASDRGTGENL